MTDNMTKKMENSNSMKGSDPPPSPKLGPSGYQQKRERAPSSESVSLEPGPSCCRQKRGRSVSDVSSDCHQEFRNTVVLILPLLRRITSLHSHLRSISRSHSRSMTRQVASLRLVKRRKPHPSRHRRLSVGHLPVTF